MNDADEYPDLAEHEVKLITATKFPKMKPAVKQAWVEALRSGKYRQGNFALRTRDGSKHTKYCCLGILCDVYKAEINTNDKIIQWERPEEGRYNFVFAIGDNEKESGRSREAADADLPPTVIKWAGLQKAEKKLVQVALIALNDSANSSFKEIADWIEEKL